MAKPRTAKDIDGYISQFPADVQAILQKVRTTISSAAPEAKEAISYLMPAFKLHGMLVYIAVRLRLLNRVVTNFYDDALRPHVTADSETWLGFLAKERSLLWALLRRRIRIKGSPKLLAAFGKCFPS